MTEYDYSPAAIKAHMAKQARIAKWAENTDGHKHHLTNPFVLSPSVAAVQAKPITPSEVYGPDRPPTPPASAPAYGYRSGGGGYFGMQQYPGYTSPVQSPNTSGPMSPTWNGYAWVYPTHQPPAATGHYHSSRRHHSSSSSRRNSIHSHSSRRNSISMGYQPPPPPRPQQHRSFSMGHLHSSVQVVSVPAGSSSPVRLSKHTSISQSPAYQVIYPNTQQQYQQPLSSPPIVYVDGAPMASGGRRGGRKLKKERY